MVTTSPRPTHNPILGPAAAVIQLDDGAPCASDPCIGLRVIRDDTDNAEAYTWGIIEEIDDTLITIRHEDGRLRQYSIDRRRMALRIEIAEAMIEGRTMTADDFNSLSLSEVFGLIRGVVSNTDV